MSWSKNNPAFPFVVAMVGVLLLAFAMRLHDLGLPSMWADEMFSLERAKLDSWREIYPILLDRNHAPLYDAFILHNWLRVGLDVFILRFPSVILSLATVAVTFALARNLFSPSVGLVSAFVLALSPLGIRYAQEMRMYSLVALFVVLTLHFLARAVEPGANRKYGILLLFAISAALALYTHYYAFLALAAVLAFALIWTAIKRDWPLFGQLLATYVLIGVLFAPWLPTFLYQLQSGPVGSLRAPTVESVSRIILQFFLHRNTLGNSYLLFAALLVFIMGFGLYRYISDHRRTSTNLNLFGLSFIAIAAIGPILTAIGISIIKPLIANRYFVPFLAPASILLAVAIVGILSFRRARLIALVLLAGLLFSAYGESTTIIKRDWAGAADHLETNADPGGIVLIVPEGGMHPPVWYFYQGPHLEFLNVERDADLPALFSEIGEAEQIWIVTPRPDPNPKKIGERLTSSANIQLRLVECESFGEKVTFVDLCLYKNWPYERVYDLPSPEFATSINWGQELSLLGYDLPEISPEEDVLPITVYWLTLKEMEKSHIAFFHLIDPQTGSLVSQTDVIPRGWTYPTDWWKAGEVIEDTVQIPMQDVPPGHYELYVGWYDEETGARLTTNSDQVQLSINDSARLTFVER
jgi:hypothetical protein